MTLFIVACALMMAIPALAQVSNAGRSVFSFMSLPTSSRLNALGGSNVSLSDGDISMGMCNPAFVMRTAEAQEHFLYTSLNEIDQFDALRGQGNQQFRIMCLAFDPANQYGQTRVGTSSVTERVTIRFNWNASPKKRILQ